MALVRSYLLKYAGHQAGTKTESSEKADEGEENTTVTETTTKAGDGTKKVEFETCAAQKDCASRCIRTYLLRDQETRDCFHKLPHQRTCIDFGINYVFHGKGCTRFARDDDAVVSFAERMKAECGLRQTSMLPTSTSLRCVITLCLLVYNNSLLCFR